VFVAFASVFLVFLNGGIIESCGLLRSLGKVSSGFLKRCDIAKLLDVGAQEGWFVDWVGTAGVLLVVVEKLKRSSENKSIGSFDLCDVVCPVCGFCFDVTSWDWPSWTNEFGWRLSF
jgi:hypothetical protein